MNIQTEAIVLSCVPFQDKNLIVKLFTSSDGLKSYFVRQATGTKNKRKLGYFQPLSVLEIQATNRNKGSLEYINEIKSSYPLKSLHINPVKSLLSLFISEFLTFALREEIEQKDLFAFLKNSIIQLDTSDHFSNIHLIIMLELSSYLGFFPQKSKGMYFDPVLGTFENEITHHSFNENETNLLKKLLSINMNTHEKHFCASERRQLLEMLLVYYHIHLGTKPKLQSYEIIKELF
jgi:DNA repair protein RecO (recombination protein O)